LKAIGVVGNVADGLGTPEPVGQAAGLPLAEPEVSMKYTVLTPLLPEPLVT
jgi:hypothetical protein